MAYRLALGSLAVVTVLAVAGCSASAASPASGAASASVSGPESGSAPVITQAQARQVFDAYVAAGGKSSALSLATGVQRAVLSLNLDAYSYGTPTFYLPAASGYPRFFVASVPEKNKDSHAGALIGNVRVPADGTGLLLFEQASAGGAWLLASSFSLAAGQAVPAFARNSAGSVLSLSPSAAGLLVKPEFAGALQAAVVDEGPANAAAKSVAAGPLTTGMYTGARDHADGIEVPSGDLYQWELEGSSLATFALQTADGGALVFYAMTLDETVAVPDVVNKAAAVRPGPVITVPLPLRTILPAGQAAPRTQLQSEDLLSFAAVDPPAADNAKLRVIGIGGGLTSASAS